MSSPLPPEAPREDALVVNEQVVIPRGELTYRATRAGGPGGQHVNTSSTRIELLWNVESSAALTDAQRALVRDKLAARLDGEGNVRVVASDSRSQLQNRERADGRLAALVRDALVVRKPRRATKPSRAAKEARLREKKKRSGRKQERRRGGEDD
jgi:ribosome-associated protein